MTRSLIRVLCGRLVYTLRRWIHWANHREMYALAHSSKLFPCTAWEHATPLFRPLPQQESWLQEHKVHNLTLAVARLDGLLLPPKKRFSFWFCVGNPTRRRGYLPGMVLSNGRVGVGVGGGLCQLSNLLYWMTLHTPLTVIERSRHGYDVFPDTHRTQPFGSGATCFYPILDLVIENRTDQIYQMHVSVEDGRLVGAWRCETPPRSHFSIKERDHRISALPFGASPQKSLCYTRENTLVQIETCDSGERYERVVARNQAIMMYEPFLKEGE